MTRYRIVFDCATQTWSIEDEFALKYNRHVTGPFSSLLEAENYVTRELCSDEVDAS